MLNFSQRYGITKVKDIVQKKTMDEDLRNSLWNCLISVYWTDMEKHTSINENDRLKYIFNVIWKDFFKLPLDTIDKKWSVLYEKVRTLFFSMEWNIVYDFIEFIANNDKSGYEFKSEMFKTLCNIILERELSAYRFVGNQIVEITSMEEIASIEEVLKNTDRFLPIKIHFETALKHLSDRKDPDFRNSIKESVSAVEAICKIIVKDEKATLGQALKTIQKSGKVQIHPALTSSFEKLYGYTSDGDGIRHALLEESRLTFEDAKYMLVSCSSFVNFLVSKSAKAELEL